MSLAEYPTSSDACDSGRFLERLLHEYDAAWAEAAVPPVLENFIVAAPLQLPVERSHFVEELVKIDLEYRWRRHDVHDIEPWTLESYAAHLQLDMAFPSCELIGEEYWVRQLWGDRPSHDEYLAKYPQHGEPLRKRLAQLDAELELQFGHSAQRAVKNRIYAIAPTYREGDDSESFLLGDTPISVSASDTNPSGGKIGPTPVVPGYEIMDVLDRGGMSVVYTARQQSLNRVVALKVIRGGEHASPKELERFRAEVEAVASLRHPNIVQVFAAGQWTGMPYCAMELVSGGSLARKLNGHPLDASSAARITAKLARALQSAHESGIVHRDLKPANVLLEPTHRLDGIELRTEKQGGLRYEPKVADFGLAKRQGDSTCHTATGELLGTPSYMAPEQAVGSHAAIGPHTDVYALGVVLYEMLTGRPPFRASSSLETLRQVIRDEPVSLRRLESTVPRDLETICLRCLEKNPHRRYLSAADLGSDLERFLVGRPILARRAGPLERAAKWSRRNPAWAVAVTIGFLAIAGFVAGTALHNRQLQVEIGRANASAAEAKRQKSQALANFNKTHETLLGMLTRLWQESQLIGDGRDRELRESLLRAMLHYYNEVPLEQADSDPDVRLTKALVEFYSAHVHHYLGDYNQAEAQFRAALPTLEELAMAHPENSVYRRSWALCCYRLGTTLKMSNQPDQSKHWLREALTILGPTSSGDLALCCLEARCRMDLARLGKMPNEIAEAMTQAEQAMTLWKTIVSAEPANDEYRWNLCVTLSFLSRLAISCGNVKRAEILVAECVATASTWKGAAGSFCVISSQADLADSYRVLAHATSDQSRYEEALAHFESAIKLLEKVREQSPQFVQAQSVAHGVYWSRATTYERMGRDQDALQDWNRCVEISGGTLRDVAWIRRAKYRLDRSDFRQAATDADELLAARELPPDMLFELATIYCHCAEAMDSSESLESDEGNGDRNELAARAVKCLARSHAAGFFSDASRRRDLQSMPALSVLRSRPDFQKLLDEVNVASVE